ncbi:hypothetical protein [uncultured Roseibium sp.]|uniref:hypothetical protein n=1 Tax=uncultured Roseibium sp. TaxID=1936171 RepID=UPI003217A583
MEYNPSASLDESTDCVSSERLTAEEKKALKFHDFDRARGRFEGCKTEVILEFLADMKSRIDEGGENAQEFDGMVVKDFIAANIVLNERVGIRHDPAPAPAFRPQPNRSWQPRKNEQELSNVVQVIDLHFLWRHGLRFSDDTLEAIVFGDTFDFDAACLFTITRGTILEKLEALGLDDDYGPHFSRLGNAVLRPPRDRDHQNWLKKARDRVLNKLSSRPVPGSADRREWADIVAADGLLERLEHASDGRPLMAITALMGRHVSERPKELERKLGCALNAMRSPTRSKQGKNNAAA